MNTTHTTLEESKITGMEAGAYLAAGFFIGAGIAWAASTYLLRPVKEEYSFTTKLEEYEVVRKTVEDIRESLKISEKDAFLEFMEALQATIQETSGNHDITIDYEEAWKKFQSHKPNESNKDSSTN